MVTEYIKNSYCREIIDGNYTLIIAHDSGTYLKLRSSIWNNIQYYIENDMEIDKRYKDIVQVLLKYGIIFKRCMNNFNYRSIMLQMTSACNLHCLHCCAQMIHSEGIVTMEIVNKVIKLNPELLVLTGGEPMMHPQFWDIVKYIRKHFHNRLRLMTNATLITEKNIDDLCYYFDSVDISLDGATAEDTSRIRGDGVYENVVDAIELLKGHGQEVSISAVVECFSESFISQFNEFASSLGVNTTLRELDVVDEVMKNFDKIVVGGKECYINTKIKTMQESVPNNIEFHKCPMIRYSLFFDVKGNAYPCGGLAKEKFCIGNIDNLSNIPDYSILEEKLLKEEKYSLCRECIYRAGCWDCLSELENRAKIPEVFRAYCHNHKKKWENILKKEE